MSFELERAAPTVKDSLTNTVNQKISLVPTTAVGTNHATRQKGLEVDERCMTPQEHNMTPEHVWIHIVIIQGNLPVISRESVGQPQCAGPVEQRNAHTLRDMPQPERPHQSNHRSAQRARSEVNPNPQREASEGGPWLLGRTSQKGPRGSRRNTSPRCAVK